MAARPRRRHGGDGRDQDGEAAHHRVSALAAAALQAGELEGEVRRTPAGANIADEILAA
jgi:hypothetical protein